MDPQIQSIEIKVAIISVQNERQTRLNKLLQQDKSTVYGPLYQYRNVVQETKPETPRVSKPTHYSLRILSKLLPASSFSRVPISRRRRTYFWPRILGLQHAIFYSSEWISIFIVRSRIFQGFSKHIHFYIGILLMYNIWYYVGGGKRSTFTYQV